MSQHRGKSRSDFPTTPQPRELNRTQASRWNEKTRETRPAKNEGQGEPEDAQKKNEWKKPVFIFVCVLFCAGMDGHLEQKLCFSKKMMNMSVK